MAALTVRVVLAAGGAPPQLLPRRLDWTAPLATVAPFAPRVRVLVEHERGHDCVDAPADWGIEEALADAPDLLERVLAGARVLLADPNAPRGAGV